MITAQIFAIGDELLDGVIADCNGKNISLWLRDQGISVQEITLCRDSDDTLKELLLKASLKHDLIITTGGLGPTKDDRTKYVLGQLIQKPLKENTHAIAIAKKHYDRIQRVWTKETNDYHLIPEGVTPLENPLGLAPGLCTLFNDCLILSAPGVPRELNSMLEQGFPEKLDEHLSSSRKKRKSIIVRTHSIHEEEIFFKKGPTLWEQLEKFGKVSSLPTSTGVDIHIKVDKDNFESHEKAIKELINSTFLKDHVWQFGDTSLPSFLIETCRKYGLTLSCAESCTGGLTSSLLTDASGCSDVYMGSAVTYSNDSKKKVLSVKEQTIKSFGAVSAQVALEMSLGALNVFDTDVAISFSGIAGPTGGSREKPVGTVAISVAHKQKQQSKVFNFHGKRVALKERFAMKGMMELLLFIESIYR